MPEVTVLMSVYNGMPYLPEAVESIRGQTLADWACVIVNDGSTDGSAEYLAGIGDPRFRTVHGPHAGLGAALNRGLECCETPLVARMDADDLVHPARLEEQLAFLQSRPEVGIVGTQIRRFGSRRTGAASMLATDHETIYRHILAGRNEMYHPTIMCRTAILHEIGGYWTHPHGEEWDLFLRAGEKARLANLDRALHFYRILPGSMSGAGLARTRSYVAYACDCARRRQAGQEPVSYEAFLERRRRLPLSRRAAEALELHARQQYRLALAELLGEHRVRGCVRLGWASLWSPLLTLQRVRSEGRRWLRASLRRTSTMCHVPWE
jgi:glycosyltransferase involved in cell wall biosynthesis